KPDTSGFDAWAEAQLNSAKDGGTGHDVSAMVNIPIAADRAALRFVAFTSKDAGYIDNIAAESQGGTFTSVAEEDVNDITTTGGRAALRWNFSDAVDATLGVTFQDVEADGHGDMNLGVGDLKQVRFEEES